MSCGRSGAACVIADCTSCAAASMFLFRSNCNVIWVCPSALFEFIASMPAIVENCFSRGVATADAIVSGLPPGNCAVTTRVGKSTLGRALSGSVVYPIIPERRIATITRVVMTGRWINRRERLTGCLSVPSNGLKFCASCPGGWLIYPNKYK